MPPILANPARIRPAAGCVTLVAGALLAGLPGPAAAAEDAQPVAADDTPLSEPPQRDWEGALGLSAQYRPEYPGAQRRVVKLTPAFFLRFGRVTITNASGFVTRRADDVVRGLGVDLLESDRVKMKLSLRYDRGRREGSSGNLAGMGDIPATVRARLVAQWRLDGPWRLGASWSVDALGRGGGNLGDISVGWEQPLTPDSQLSAGLSLALAGDRYMQTYFGVTAEQSARTGRPVYEPGAGLRDATGWLNWRFELGPMWSMQAGLSASRQLDAAAASPLTTERNGWSIGLAGVRRF